MDHLKSSEERKDRWYAKDLQPIYASVEDIQFGKNNEITNEHNPISQKRSVVVVNGIPCKYIDIPKANEYIKSHLQTYGFVVITKALSMEDCNHALKLLWDYLEAASAAEQFLRKNVVEEQQQRKDNDDPNYENKKRKNSTILRMDPTTYDTVNLPRSVEGGILPFYGSGHTSFMWFLRSHPSVQKVFGLLHETPVHELASSLDGIIAWLHPPTDKGWFHIDQNPITKPNFESVQGLVNLLPVDSASGGNVLVVKSHLLFPDHYASAQGDKGLLEKCDRKELFYEDRLKEINGDDWLEIDPHDSQLLDASKIISCKLEPGDILIWDSRLVHCSHPPTKYDEDCDNVSITNLDKLEERRGLLRAAGLVNMVPRSRVSKETRSARIDSTMACRTLTHWVEKAAPLGEERSEEIKKEKECIDFIFRMQQSDNFKNNVLLSFDKLTTQQKNLV